MVQNSPEWSKMVQNGPKWSQLVPNGPEWSLLVPDVLKCSQMVLSNYLTNIYGYEMGANIGEYWFTIYKYI